ncbi:hypothetical protein HKBW3S25_00077 [Candidatus Hakubella thermalkaliphila]|uniref:Uncharacterized protein n=1 Tax=Candidatus Hakubella thermalkaliphila TaxID=2754717 RepID=A0A6V8NWN5_9ACTN|nr:hypothetical protein HKBW3S25_00077 [Candidatus Hakubella thermalkaliphila]
MLELGGKIEEHLHFLLEIQKKNSGAFNLP